MCAKSCLFINIFVKNIAHKDNHACLGKGFLKPPSSFIRCDSLAWTLSQTPTLLYRIIQDSSNFTKRENPRETARTICGRDQKTVELLVKVKMGKSRQTTIKDKNKCFIDPFLSAIFLYTYSIITPKFQSTSMSKNARASLWALYDSSKRLEVWIPEQPQWSVEKMMIKDKSDSWVLFCSARKSELFRNLGFEQLYKLTLLIFI